MPPAETPPCVPLPRVCSPSEPKPQAVQSPLHQYKGVFAAAARSQTCHAGVAKRVGGSPPKNDFAVHDFAKPPPALIETPLQNPPGTSLLSKSLHSTRCSHLALLPILYSCRPTMPRSTNPTTSWLNPPFQTPTTPAPFWKPISRANSRAAWIGAR